MIEAEKETAATLAIGEVAAAAGVRTSTIRYYESRGLITPIERVSGRRRFKPAAIRRLFMINLCIQAGFSLDECLVLLTDRTGNREESRSLGDKKLVEIDEQITALAAARRLIEVGLACSCEALEDCSCNADIGSMLPTSIPEPPTERAC